MANPTYNIPTQKTDTRSWQEWHKDLLSTGMGKDKANQVWLAYWADRGMNKDDNDLRIYMRKYDIDLTSNIFEKIGNVGHSIGGTIGGIFSGAKWTIIVLGGLTLLAAGSLLITVISKPLSSLQAAGGMMGKGKRR